MMNRSTAPFRFLSLHRPDQRRIGDRLGSCRALGLAALALLAACQSPPPAPGSAEPPVSAGAPAPATAEPAPPAAAPARPSLIDEQRRLAALFRGTPVVFTMLSESRLQVDVPLRHSFDAGQSTVKAPLAAVLDRIALSQGEGMSRLSISATSDRAAVPARAASAGSAAGGKSVSAATARQERLAAERRRSMTDYLVRKGIDASRLVAGAAMPAGTSVRLLVDERPAP